MKDKDFSLDFLIDRSNLSLARNLNPDTVDMTYDDFHNESLGDISDLMEELRVSEERAYRYWEDFMDTN